jgi:hypothetical protein
MVAAAERPEDWQPKDRQPEELRAVARLPGGLDVELRHRRTAGGSEQVVVSLTAPAGFEAWGRLMEASHPMLAWMRLAEAAWAPWLALMAPRARPLPGREPPGRG